MESVLSAPLVSTLRTVALGPIWVRARSRSGIFTVPSFSTLSMPAWNIPASAGHGIFFASAAFSPAENGHSTLFGATYPALAPSMSDGGGAGGPEKPVDGFGAMGAVGAAAAFVAGAE